MSQDEFCLEVSHRIYYSNKQPIPIPEIASSLLALERIIHRLPGALTAVTAVPINRIEVYVEELQSGSLIEDIIIKLAFKDQQGLDAFLLKIREQLGQHKVTRNVLIGALILAIIGYGVYQANVATGNSAGAQAVNVNNNVIINIAADQSGISPEKLADIVSAAVRDKKANAKDAVAFIKPAKLDPSATIRVGDQQSPLELTSDTIQRAPSSLEIDTPPHEVLYPDVDLHVRATNLDSHSSGWAGLIPGLIDKRVKLVLDDGVDPREVAGKFTIRANVVVHSRPQGKGQNLTPYQITVMKIIKP